MKLSLEWLNQYLARPVTVEEVDTVLERQGFPVEEREDVELAGGGKDVMVDAEVTSNRSDCLSHVGVAREVSAGLSIAHQPPSIDLPTGVDDINAITSVTNEELQLCPLYTARVIRGVKVGPSPAWMVSRLEAIGLRSVNNVVDVTNYVLMEFGQPLHTFDLAKLADQRVVVRRAREGEAFTAIDGTKHKLTTKMLVIADAQRPQAVAGVMGGLDSEVSGDTTDILIEAAIFDPLATRRTSRALKLSSDSSYRFERGVDPQGVDVASRRAAALILELAGGELVEGVIEVGRDVPGPKPVTMRLARCRALLGVDLDAATMADYLERLRLDPTLEGEGKGEGEGEVGGDSDGAKVTCRVPTFRLDLHREVDLIEEVGRMHGFANVPVAPKMTITARGLQRRVAARRRLAQVLTSHGYHEALLFSFIAPKTGEPFVPAGEVAMQIGDERRKAEPMLRPALVPSLMQCRKANQDVGNSGIRLFEVASTYTKTPEDAVIERQHLGLLLDAEDKQTALRDLRGTIDELCEQLTGQPVTLALGEHANLEGSATLKLADQVLGVMGLIDAATLDLFKLQTPVACAELEVGLLLDGYPPAHTVGDLPRYPGIERDVSIVVDEATPWGEIAALIDQASPRLAERVQFVTTYRSKQIGAGRKSVTFRLAFRDPTRTLRHDEVDPEVDKVVSLLKSKLSAELRV